MSATIRPRAHLTTAEGAVALIDEILAIPPALRAWPLLADWVALAVPLQARGYEQGRALQIAGRARLRHHRRHQQAAGARQ